MSKKRQHGTQNGTGSDRPSDPPRGSLVRTLSMHYATGSNLPPHSHDWGQLVYASEGVMTVSTPGGSWVVPPHRAVWIPPGIEHWIEMSGSVFMRTLYLTPVLVTPLPQSCCVVQVSRLLRELILHSVALGVLEAEVPEHAHLVAFLIDLLETVPTMPLELPMPRDPRALRVAEFLREHPADATTANQLARTAGASVRTLERLFRSETGLTFGRWRQQLRLLEALRLLAAGRPVTAVALDVGYDSPSAFIAMFKNTLGTTPSRYYAD